MSTAVIIGITVGKQNISNTRKVFPSELNVLIVQEWTNFTYKKKLKKFLTHLMWKCINLLFLKYYVNSYFQMFESRFFNCQLFLTVDDFGIVVDNWEKLTNKTHTEFFQVNFYSLKKDLQSSTPAKYVLH